MLSLALFPSGVETRAMIGVTPLPRVTDAEK